MKLLFRKALSANFSHFLATRLLGTVLAVAAVFSAATAGAQEGVWTFNIGSYNYGIGIYGAKSEAEAISGLLQRIAPFSPCATPEFVRDDDWFSVGTSGLILSKGFRIRVGIPGPDNTCQIILGANVGNEILAQGQAQSQQCNPAPTSLPVIPGVGAKLWQETDYSGAGAHPLSFERHYRTGGLIGLALSAKWTHNYSQRIEPAAFTDRWLAVRPNGYYLVFRILGNTGDTFAPVDIFSQDTLSKVPVGTTGVPAGAYWKLGLADTGQTEYYNQAGQVLAVVERNGWTTSLSYNVNQQLTAITNRFGRKLTLAYNALGQMASLTDPADGRIGYGYDASGNLASVTWQDGAIKRYHYEDTRLPGFLTGITDEAGVRIRSVAYDARGRVILSEIPGTASRTQFQYAGDTIGSGLNITDDTAPAAGQPSNRNFSFSQINGKVLTSSVSAPGPLCGATAAQTAYDTYGKKIKEIAHDGTVAFFAYDSTWRESQKAVYPSTYATSATQPALNLATSVTSTQWHATWNLPVKIAEPRKTTAFTYDAKGNLTGRSETITTDATGALAFTAARDMSQPINATGYSYNATTQLLASIVEKQTPANGTAAVEIGKWTNSYNNFGDTTKVTNSSGSVVNQATQLDSNGRFLAGTIDGDPVSFLYSSRGLVTRKTSSGFTVNSALNATGTLREQTLSSGDKLSYQYSPAGKLLDIKFNDKTIVGNRLQTLSAAGLEQVEQITTANKKGTLERLLSFFISDAHAQSEVLLPACGLGPNPVCITGVVITACKVVVVAGAAILAVVATSSTACAADKKDCNKDKDDCDQTATPWELQQAGLDPHELKKHLGRGSLFDFCKCKSGGFVVKRKGCNGPVVEDYR